MTELLLKPARDTGCTDLAALQEAVDEAQADLAAVPCN